MYTPTDSFLIDRWLDRLPWSRRWSFVILVVILLLIMAVVYWTFWRGGGFEIVPATGLVWLRPIFPPLVIVYSLIAVQLLARTRENVVRSLRPLVQVDDEAFLAIVRRACRANPLVELFGFAIGGAFFLLVEGRFSGSPEYYWLSLYYYVVSFVMFGAIGWTVYAVITITQLTNSLLRQPIQVDIFDVTPLQPIGTQSLYLSLVFLGAIILSFPSSPYPLLSWQNIVIYSVLTVIIVLVFFVNMYSTHRMLAHTKEQELAAIEREFAQIYRQLRELAAGDQNTHSAAAALNAWAVAKQELKVTRTWPYNTEMLRTLFISVMTPLAVGLARLVAALLARGEF